MEEKQRLVYDRPTIDQAEIGWFIDQYCWLDCRVLMQSGPDNISDFGQSVE